jgi:hypothetical protein
MPSTQCSLASAVRLRAAGVLCVLACAALQVGTADAAMRDAPPTVDEVLATALGSPTRCVDVRMSSLSRKWATAEARSYNGCPPSYEGQFHVFRRSQGFWLVAKRFYESEPRRYCRFYNRRMPPAVAADFKADASALPGGLRWPECSVAKAAGRSSHASGLWTSPAHERQPNSQFE